MKKFIYTEEGIEILNNKEVYVINFSTLRDHYNYTERSFFSNYSGALYINKDDYAVVKVIENWEVTKCSDDVAQAIELQSWPKSYTKKEDKYEVCETNFIKIGNLYYLANSKNNLSGNLIDEDNNVTPFKIAISNSWCDFNTSNPVPFSFKDEINNFDKVNYNKIFWETFKLPE